MRFFKIDGEKNEKQLSVRLNDMSIQNAVFRKNSSGSEVLACGRKPFFYSYDTVSGNVAKIPGPAGRGVKSLEHLAVSPEGSLLAFRGASGYVHLCRYILCVSVSCLLGCSILLAGGMYRLVIQFILANNLFSSQYFSCSVVVRASNGRWK